MTAHDVGQILDALSVLGERMAVLETKLDGSHDHDSRINQLERRWAGVTAIVAFLALEVQLAALALAIIAQ